MHLENVQRVGYLGKKRDEKTKECNNLYGEGNWKFQWIVGNDYVDFLTACGLYEEAYYKFLKNNDGIRDLLCQEASDVYDDSISNIYSGFDYLIQETSRTHIQDIAIRTCLYRLNSPFRGNNLIKIRQEKGDHCLSMLLSPGVVPFYKPELIVKPQLEGWWKSNTVESFYQSNRVLVINDRK